MEIDGVRGHASSLFYGLEEVDGDKAGVSRRGAVAPMAKHAWAGETNRLNRERRASGESNRKELAAMIDVIEDGGPPGAWWTGCANLRRARTR